VRSTLSLVTRDIYLASQRPPKGGTPETAGRFIPAHLFFGRGKREKLIGKFFCFAKKGGTAGQKRDDSEKLLEINIYFFLFVVHSLFAWQTVEKIPK
jgi:hypothetical protein